MRKRMYGVLPLVVVLCTSCDITGQIQAIVDHLAAIEDELSSLTDGVTAEFEDFAVSVDFASTQYGQTGPEWVFQMLFDDSTTIDGLRSADPSILIASSGPTLGATIVKINIHTDTPFYVTGARIENVRYRTEVSSVSIDYFHPVLGDFCPIFSSLPTSASYTGSVAAIPVNPDVDNVFEVGLSTELGLWDHVDYDGDGFYFPADQDETITVQGSLFFEGYTLDGREFSGNFPMPLHLDMTISHTT